MFYEAESIEEVRKIVKSDIYYTSGVVRLSLFPAHSPPMLLFVTVEQGECRHRTVCAGDALAVDIDRIKLSGRSPIKPLPHISSTSSCWD